MAHTYNRKYLNIVETMGNPLTAAAMIAIARYTGAGDTVANIATALAASADAASLLPKGSAVLITSLESGSVAAAWYLVTANAGTSLTLASAATVGTAGLIPLVCPPVTLADGSTILLAPGFAGTVKGITTVARGQVSTNAAVCTFKIGTTAITNGVVTIAAAGAAGDVDSATPTAANVFTATDYLQVTVSGTPGGSIVAVPTLLVSPS